MKAGERRSTFTRTPPVGCNRQLREDEAKAKGLRVRRSVNSVMFSIYALRAFREGKTKAQRALLLPSGAGLLIRRRGIACTGAVRHDRPRRGAPHATPACTRAKAELDQNACPVQPYDSNRNITCQSTALCFCATPPPMCGSACPAGHRP